MNADDLIKDFDGLGKVVKDLNSEVDRQRRSKEKSKEKENAGDRDEEERMEDEKEEETVMREERIKSVNRTVDRIDKIAEKYENDPDYEALIKLVDDGIMMELPDILNNLEIRQKYFEENLAKNPMEFVVYYRQKLELSATYLYDTLQDLEADGKPGQFGQRLPGLFKKVRDNYTNEELPRDVGELLDAGNDINKLISATVQLALKFGAAHDLGLYILISLSKKRNELIEEIEVLNNQAESIKDEIAEISEEKRKLVSEIEGKKMDAEKAARKIEEATSNIKGGEMAVKIKGDEMAVKAKLEEKNKDEEKEEDDEEEEKEKSRDSDVASILKKL